MKTIKVSQAATQTATLSRWEHDRLKKKAAALEAELEKMYPRLPLELPAHMPRFRDRCRYGVRIGNLGDPARPEIQMQCS